MKERDIMNEIVRKIIFRIKWEYYLRFRSVKERANLQYKYINKKDINFDNPKTLNEKIQWLKFNWFDEKAIIAANKFKVRDYVTQMGYKDCLVPLLGIYDNFNQIDFSKLPEEMMIKATLDSGEVIKINKDTYQSDVKKAEKLFNSKKRKNSSRNLGEWVYDINQKNQIIIEKVLHADDGSKSINDYKFFCFFGEPKFLFVATDRGYNTKFTFFDMTWNKLQVKNHYPIDAREIKKPINFDYMKKMASDLSSEFPFVRVDLYEVDSKVYFGELTFFHFSGQEPFEPYEFEIQFGNYLDISKIRKSNF